ncbi:hypothetical protein [Bombilactobacillus apium]|uniref:hypothetical protein n=1 Tax=Bombilactobacillus apium TaxID=2675299 RepID=UPI002B4B5C48|nr:hypothetical protein [Bombilactobacillus apium]
MLQEPNRRAYLLMDQRTWEVVYQLLVLHDFSASEIQAYFDHPDQRPIFARGSLATVAQIARIPAGQLQTTLTNYQNYAAQKNDPEFHRDPQYLQAYQGDTYYLMEQGDRFATTLGGYFIDPQHLNLQTKDQTLIPNYFGAGEIIGGVNGNDSMPSMINTWAIASAYVAG